MSKELFASTINVGVYTCFCIHLIIQYVASLEHIFNYEFKINSIFPALGTFNDLALLVSVKLNINSCALYIA